MRFTSSNEALASLAGMVLKDGKLTAPRDKPTKELLGVQFVLTDPRARIVTLPSRRFSLPLALGELCWHLRGDNDVGALAYYAEAWRAFTDNGHHVSGSCYGRKLLGDETSGPSGWDRLVSLLRRDPSTRRATFSFIGNDEDVQESKDISCVSSIQFMLRGGRLHLFTFMRSNDLFLGLPYDVFLFTYFLELMSLELGVEVGEYHHYATSLHIYEHNIAACEKIALEREFSDGRSPEAASKQELINLALAEKSIRLGLGSPESDGQFSEYIDALVSFRTNRQSR